MDPDFAERVLTEVLDEISLPDWRLDTLSISPSGDVVRMLLVSESGTVMTAMVKMTELEELLMGCAKRLSKQADATQRAWVDLKDQMGDLSGMKPKSTLFGITGVQVAAVRMEAALKALLAEIRRKK